MSTPPHYFFFQPHFFVSGAFLPPPPSAWVYGRTIFPLVFFTLQPLYSMTPFGSSWMAGGTRS